MGTAASVQNTDSVDGPQDRHVERKLVRGPLPIEGKPYVFYPAQASASIRPNNVSAFDDTLVYTSKNRVVFVETAKKTRLKSSVFRSDGVIHQTKACTIAGPSGPLRVIVVGQTSGLVLWNFDTQQRIAKHTLPQSEFTERTVPFMRGITSSATLIFVGTSTGRVMSFNAEGAVETTLYVSEHTVTDLVHFAAPAAAGGGAEPGASHLAVATSEGAIAVWTGTPKMKREYVVQPARHSMATSLTTVPGGGGGGVGGGGAAAAAAAWPLLVAGFSCGHIRVFSTARREIVAEIAAHARPVSGLAASVPAAGRPARVVSSGEDSVLNVWTIAAEDKITLDFSEPLDNTLVVGACFMGADQATLAVTAFDYEGVFTWRLPLAVAGKGKGQPSADVETGAVARDR